MKTKHGNLSRRAIGLEQGFKKLLRTRLKKERKKERKVSIVSKSCFVILMFVKAISLHFPDWDITNMYSLCWPFLKFRGQEH